MADTMKLKFPKDLEWGEEPIYTAGFYDAVAQIHEAIERVRVGWAPLIANNEKQLQQCNGAQAFADALKREIT